VPRGKGAKAARKIELWGEVDRSQNNQKENLLKPIFHRNNQRVKKNSRGRDVVGSLGMMKTGEKRGRSVDDVSKKGLVKQDKGFWD